MHSSPIPPIPPYTDDTPAKRPSFNFELIAKGLARALARGSDAAVVVGIHGPWGSGKTTLLKAVRQAIETQPDAQETVFVEFNAWKYREREALWRALILHVIAALREQEIDKSSLDELEESLYRTVTVREAGPWSVDWRSLIVEIAAIALSVLRVGFVADWLRGSSKFFTGLFGRNKKDDAGVIGRQSIETLSRVIERTTVDRQIAHVRSIEQFLGRFQDLMNDALQRGLRVCVLVDDLDRCLPEAALEVFEAVKLFLDAPGCGFVVALDRDVIRKGLALRYPSATAGERSVDPDAYVEKTISISYDLPRLSVTDMNELAANSGLPFTLTDEEQQLCEAGLGTNPRRWKRFVNLLLLHRDLSELSSPPAQPQSASLWSDPPSSSRTLYLKLLLLAYRYSGIFGAAMDDPDLLSRLQKASNTYESERNRANGDLDAARRARGKALEAERTVVQQLALEEMFWKLLSGRPDLNSGDAKDMVAWLGTPGMPQDAD